MSSMGWRDEEMNTARDDHQWEITAKRFARDGAKVMEEEEEEEGQKQHIKSKNTHIKSKNTHKKPYPCRHLGTKMKCYQSQVGTMCIMANHNAH